MRGTFASASLLRASSLLEILSTAARSLTCLKALQMDAVNGDRLLHECGMISDTYMVGEGVFLRRACTSDRWSLPATRASCLGTRLLHPCVAKGCRLRVLAPENNGGTSNIVHLHAGLLASEARNTCSAATSVPCQTTSSLSRLAA